jgi:hypothetical protein
MTLIEKIKMKEAHIGVNGMGYVGLPLRYLIAERLNGAHCVSPFGFPEAEQRALSNVTLLDGSGAGEARSGEPAFGKV